MKKKYSPVIRTQLLIFLVFFGMYIIVNPGCRCWHNGKNSSSNVISSDSLIKYRNYDTNQVIIWLKPGVSKDSLNKWLVEFNITNISDSFFCGSCDGTLLLLKGTGILTLIQSARGGSQSSAKSKPSGDNGPFYYSANFPLEFSDSIVQQGRDTNKDTIPRITPVKDSVIIAVFDTGVDSTFIKPGYFYKNNEPSCLGIGANNGWNFAGSNNNWFDDLPQKHGTLVTKFIIDQVDQYGQNGIRILPVKTHDATGSGNLFNILCGFAYAKQRGAKIINASFGYYAPRNYKDDEGNIIVDSSALLLKEYIHHYLSDSILLITAAGNTDLSGYEEKIFHPTDPKDLRNLDSVCFYPASLAGEIKNVIAVTTVKAGSVSSNQNFSGKIVDLGVNGDVAFGSSFYFLHPFIIGGTVTGSSFSAPIVTGKLCANYSRIQSLINAGGYTKEQIFQALETSPAIVTKDPLLNGKIKNTTVTGKAK